MKVSELIEKLKGFSQDSEVFLTLDPELSIDENTMAVGEIREIDCDKLYLYETSLNDYPLYRDEADTLEAIGDETCFRRFHRRGI